MRRILVAAAAVVLGALVSVASPAQAASGPWSVVSSGAHHTCAINTSKSLYCWGYNSNGQIGDGTVGHPDNDRHSPTRIGSAGVWAAVSAGGQHTCAITTGKSLYCWGYNEYGQIGDGTSGSDQPSPKKIGTAGAWRGVSAGMVHTCATSTGDSLYCWGLNNSGQVGDGTSGNTRPSPTKIGTSGVWAGAISGGLHTCAITTGKSLYCWGHNEYGQVGDGTTDQTLSPKKIGTTGVWSLADPGFYHTCAISTGKSLYCWGLNTTGQIGDGTSGTDRFSPKKIGTTGVWERVTSGGYTAEGHTCATTTGNSLYCWGYNPFGQVGDGTTDQRLSPKKIGATGVWAGASAGGHHSCSITAGKALYCWGNNTFGQIGDGAGGPGTDRLSPKKVP